tara:strand:+ start:460 stop:615 length:156 start_codon:yes stop_codon:yes gene_type:complete
MERLTTAAIVAGIFYLWVNALADNPREIQKFRNQMNSIVSDVYNAAKRAVS